MKILHVMYSSLPDVTGSSIRSDGLLVGQSSCGLEPHVVTSPFQRPYGSGKTEELINGIKYYRTYNGKENQQISESHKPIFLRIKKLAQIVYFSYKVVKLQNALKADVVHSHSTFFCAFAGYLTAKLSKIPFVYEVRSLWEERISKKSFVNRVGIKVIKFLELHFIKSADAVVVINKSLADYIVSKGVDPQRVNVFPNCVSNELISANSKETWSGMGREKLRLAYVGNISDIEGLDLLIESFAKVFNGNEERLEKLKIYGDGSYRKSLESSYDSFKNIIEFMGGFERKDIFSIYQGLDCIVIPRRRSLLTMIVTPLKPLEAMAFKKLVVVSDVQGLVEVIGENSQALKFRSDDPDDLVKVLENILRMESNDIIAIIKNEFEYIESKRSWATMANGYKKMYRKLVESI